MTLLDLIDLTRQFLASPLILLSLGFATARLSEAAPVYTTSVTVIGDTLFNVTKSGASPTDSLSWSDSIGNGSSVVDSGPGVVRAHTMTQLTLDSSPGSTLSVYGQANSRFQDSFLVSAQDGDGAEILSGFLTAEVYVNAESTLSPDLGGDSLFSSILWSFSVGSESRNGRSLASLPFGSSSSISGGDFELLIPWSADVPVAINFHAVAEAQVAAQTAGTRTAIADFSNSMVWGGITSLTDTSGTPVAEFTALNDQRDSYIEPAIGPGLPGDVNGDGRVDYEDVDPFLDVLLNGPYRVNADMNGDDLVNGLDVGPFSSVVTGGTARAVAEPSAVALAGVGVLTLFVCTWRRRKSA